LSILNCFTYFVKQQEEYSVLIDTMWFMYFSWW